MSTTNTNQTNEADPSSREPSPSSGLYTTATPMRFTPNGTTQLTASESSEMLDPRTVQQRLLDAAEARLAKSQPQTQEMATSYQILRDEIEERGREHSIEINNLKTALNGHVREVYGVLNCAALFCWLAVALVAVCWLLGVLVALQIWHRYHHDFEQFFKLLFSLTQAVTYQVGSPSTW
ncbi:hypothetical protein F53441_8252 [Fusarium austroafricanum]|uniref:Uncharacterized protein n=1 Tax=Fusarium austroafricanum TaxID=2364996 RepID=A0A8H4KEU1_9HYPO|nr:hypothetical protein F53441_8252 [Fusarium austroafricanum]